MPSFTVTEYKREKTWEGKFGAMKDHVIDVRDDMGQTKEVSLSQKESTPAPKVGETLELTLENTNWGIKAKRVHQQGGGGGGGWKPRDPAETAAIQRQHSQEMALMFAAISPVVGKALIDKSASDSLTMVIKPLVDFFERDIKDSAKEYGKEPARKDSVRTGASDVPSDAPQHPSLGPSGDLPWSDAA